VYKQAYGPTPRPSRCGEMVRPSARLRRVLQPFDGREDGHREARGRGARRGGAGPRATPGPIRDRRTDAADGERTRLGGKEEASRPRRSVGSDRAAAESTSRRGRRPAPRVPRGAFPVVSPGQSRQSGPARRSKGYSRPRRQSAGQPVRRRKATSKFQPPDPPYPLGVLNGDREVHPSARRSSASVEARTPGSNPRWLKKSPE